VLVGLAPEAFRVTSDAGYAFDRLLAAIVSLPCTGPGAGCAGGA